MLLFGKTESFPRQIFLSDAQRNFQKIKIYKNNKNILIYICFFSLFTENTGSRKTTLENAQTSKKNEKLKGESASLIS